MTLRSLALLLVALALAALVGQAALADDQNLESHEGKVVKAGEGKLTMTSKDTNKEMTHDVAADAKITCDGKECKLEDLKAGYTVKVWTKKGSTTATKIEAKSTAGK
jgi:hypothetical protein